MRQGAGAEGATRSTAGEETVVSGSSSGEWELNPMGEWVNVRTQTVSSGEWEKEDVSPAAAGASLSQQEEAAAVAEGIRQDDDEL